MDVFVCLSITAPCQSLCVFTSNTSQHESRSSSTTRAWPMSPAQCDVTSCPVKRLCDVTSCPVKRLCDVTSCPVKRLCLQNTDHLDNLG